MRNLVKQTFTAFLAFSIFFTNTAVGLATEIPETKPAPETQETTAKTPLHFQSVMRDIADLKDNKSRPHQSTLLSELDQLITQEQERLDKLNIPKDKQDRYFKQLNAQVEFITNYQPGDSKPSALPEFTPLKNPSSFSTKLKTNSKVKYLSNLKVYKQKEQPKNIESFLKTLRLEKTAEAYIAGYLPVIEDLKNNDFETEITPAIQELAADLGYNPVNIYNFVHNNIDYSPYYGSKKGATACLIEQSCNDVDTSSLTIALMRASGIPARYEQGLALLTTEQLQNLIGTDQIANAYYAFQGPIFTINGEGNLEGQNLLEADFQNVTHVAVSWVHPEIFYPYDERGANFPNNLSLLSLDTTADLQNLYGDFSSEQWLPVEPTLKSYTLQANNILHDQANFNTEQFWQNYLSYQGDLSPIELYAQQLQNQTGQSISDPANQSTKTIAAQTFELLPPTLPYQLASGQSDGQQFNINNFTILPNSLKSEVEISLLSAADNQVFFTETFPVSEVNNQPIELVYNGFTDQDKNTLVAHGGIAYTPAALADIAPILKLNDRNYIGQTPLEIGQEMILQFRYTQNNEEILTDQKYSTAGNNEGIFIYFDRLQENHLLDDPDNPDRKSQILLSGNAYIAREYLRNIQADADLLVKSLDATATVAVNRAVVTQKRLLNRVDDLPTTFDFKGLNIDASSHFNYHSNRTSPELHSDDFTNLWLLSASNYEAQVFEDLTGLNAISTVKGLQYAHANPNDYTVHTITAANENIIDGLNLSANTKQNFHDAVSAGATIITPNRQVQMDNWLGHLYITKNPNGPDNYAIGEQVPGNGGDTSPELEDEENCNEEGSCTRSYRNNDPERLEDFHFTDRSVDSIACSTDRDSLLPEIDNDNLPANAPEWEYWYSDYGLPCFKETTQYGDTTHTYVLSDFGAKFTGENPSGMTYNYWTHRDVARHLIEQNTNQQIDEGFRFNPIAKTFYYYDADDESAYYYEPKQPTTQGEDWHDEGLTHQVSGPILEKLMEPYYLDLNLDNEEIYGTERYAVTSQWVLNKLGFPVGEAAHHYGDNDILTSVLNQDFIGGDIFSITRANVFFVPDKLEKPFTKTFYVPQPFKAYYESPELCTIEGECEAHGVMGAPIGDPSYYLGVVQYQSFQNGRIVYDAANNFLQGTLLEEGERRTENKRFANDLLAMVLRGDITDAEAFIQISNNVALKVDNDTDFVNDMTILLVGTDKIVTGQVLRLADMVKWKTIGEPAYDVQEHKLQLVEGWSDTGFQFKYNDSHYGWGNGVSNQLHHSMGGFAAGYFWTEPLGDLASWGHDFTPWINPLGHGGYSEEDLRLSYLMSQWGSGLRFGINQKELFGEFILTEVADNNLHTLRKSRDDIKSEAIIKQKFRIFEYESNGNIEDKWKYSQDMSSMECQGETVYTQRYDSFYVAGVNLPNAIAIWVPSRERMTFPVTQGTLQETCDRIDEVEGSRLSLQFALPTDEEQEALGDAFDANNYLEGRLLK